MKNNVIVYQYIYYKEVIFCCPICFESEKRIHILYQTFFNK